MAVCSRSGGPVELVLPYGLQADGKDASPPPPPSCPPLPPSLPPNTLSLGCICLSARAPPSKPDKLCASCPHTQPWVR